MALSQKHFNNEEQGPVSQIQFKTNMILGF